MAMTGLLLLILITDDFSDDFSMEEEARWHEFYSRTRSIKLTETTRALGGTWGIVLLAYNVVTECKHHEANNMTACTALCQPSNNSSRSFEDISGL